MEDDLRNQIENVLSTSPVVNPRVPTIAVEEKEPLANTPAMPAEQSTYQSGGSDYAIRTNVSANEPEPIDVAPYKGAGHLSNTRLANTEYGPHGALYYKTKYAPVVPFKTMYGNAEMLTSTKAKNKQSWEFDTSILGLPDLRYVGYNRIEPPTENLIQAFGRSVWNLLPWAGETIGRFGRNVIEATDGQEISAPEQLKAVMPHLFPKRPGSDIVDNISAVYRAAQEQGLINYDNKTKRFSVGDGKKKAEGQEPADVYSLNPWFASAMDDFAQWSKDNFYWTYTDENETGASDRARVAMGLGSGTGTVALSVMAPWLTGTVAATEAMDAFNDVYETNVSNGVPAKRAAVLATGAGTVVGALGALPEIGGKIAFNSLYQAERNLLKSATNKAARMSLLNHSRPVTKNVSRAANAVTMAGEMITEPLQTDVTNFAANNLDWSVFDTPRWDERAIEIAAAFLGSVVGGAVNTRSLMSRYDDYNKRAEDFRARVSDTVETYRPILEGAVKNGILTKEQMEQLINIAYLPENFDYAMDFVQDSIAGQLDKIPGEMIEDFQKRLEAIDPNVVLEDEMKKLDQKVLEAIAKANKNGKYASKNPFTDEDAALITALFRGIANWKIYNDGVLPSQIEVPDLSPFRRQPKGGVEYGATTTVDGKVTRVTIGNNVLPVDMPSSAKPTAYDSLIPKDNPNVDRTISARHSNILHEIGGHLLEKMVGIKGSGAFFNEFYRAIEMAFGKKRAIEVEKAEDKSDAKQTKKNYTSPENKSENFAQAMGALAENAARAAGIEGTPADFLTFANLMLNGMNKATVLNEAIRNYIDELEVAIKENEELVADLVNVFGTERTNNALKEFMSPDVKELSDSASPADFLAGLVEAINGFASAKSLPQLREMFAGIDPDDFVAKTQKLFKDALNAGRENVNNATPENKALYARATKAAQDNALVASVIDMFGPKAADLASDDLSESEDLETSKFGLPTLDSFYVPETEAPTQQTEAGKLLEDKVKDRTLSQDISNTLSIVKSTAQNAVTKLLNKLYKQPWVGTLADKLNAVGGERLKSLFDLVGDASKYEIKLRNLQSRFVSSIKNATGTNDVSLIALNSKLSQTVTNAKVRSIPNSDVGAFEQPIDGFVVMDLYLNKMQGDDIFERTKAGYATGEVDRILNEYLTPEIKAYGDGILSFYQSVKGDVERARGKTIGLDEEFYAPISNAFYSGLTAQGINSMMARTDKNSALVGENALELADKYIRRLASSLAGRYQTLKRLNDVIFLAPDKELTATSTREERAEVERLKTQSSELRGAIRDVIGEDGLQNLRHDIENELAFNDVTPYVKSGALNKIGNSTVTGLLAWNPLSFFKNAANVFGFWGRADSTSQYLSDTMYALMHPKEVIEYMWQFDVIKNRFAGKGIDDLLNTDIAGGESVLTDLRNALKYNDSYNLTGTIAGITSVGNRWGLKAFMQSGDAFANIFGGYGYVKSLERRGLTKDQINNEFQKTIDETQSSSNQAMKNALQKEWQRQGLLANFIAFSQEPMAKAKTITDALLAYSRGEITAKEFGKRVAPIILAVSVFAMISSGFMDLWDDDENKRDEAHKSLINEAIQSLAGITPFGNTFVAPFIEYAIGTMDNPTFSPSLISETRKALNDMSQGDVDGIITRGLTFTGMLQGAPRLYNVISGGLKQFSDNETERNIGSYQLWGRSENYAKKRATGKK